MRSASLQRAVRMICISASSPSSDDSSSDDVSFSASDADCDSSSTPSAHLYSAFTECLNDPDPLVERRAPHRAAHCDAVRVRTRLATASQSCFARSARDFTAETNRLRSASLQRVVRMIGISASSPSSDDSSSDDSSMSPSDEDCDSSSTPSAHLYSVFTVLTPDPLVRVRAPHRAAHCDAVRVRTRLATASQSCFARSARDFTAETNRLRSASLQRVVRMIGISASSPSSDDSSSDDSSMSPSDGKSVCPK